MQDDRFWSKVDIGPPGDCWPYRGGINVRGYGVHYLDNKGHGAHRYAWGLANGTPPPAGAVVRHSCDNRPCCNPAHLILGTQQENVADMVDRLRFSRKLTASDVAEIRCRRVAGEKVRSLASDYGVSIATISRAATGRTWGHLPDAPPPLRPKSRTTPRSNASTLLVLRKQANQKETAHV